MKLHEQETKSYKSFTFQELETNDRIRQYLQLTKPQNYDSYPRRAFGIPVFPPPRIIPPSNTTENLIITSIGKYGQPLPLLNLATYSNAIPMHPMIPDQYNKPHDTKNLVDIL